jgi:hypothetical protein
MAAMLAILAAETVEPVDLVGVGTVAMAAMVVGATVEPVESAGAGVAATAAICPGVTVALVAVSALISRPLMPQEEDTESVPEAAVSVASERHCTSWVSEGELSPWSESSVQFVRGVHVGLLFVPMKQKNLLAASPAAAKLTVGAVSVTGPAVTA